MRSQKMTKQVKAMVEDVNKYLWSHHVKDQRDTQFSFLCYLLVRAGCYHGFNYFTTDGRLSGGDNENFDHLQFYIV